MRIALTGIGIIGAGLFIDWITGPYAALAFTFFGVWALLLSLSAVFVSGPAPTPEESPADEPVGDGSRVTNGS
ncbi:hypothetical protein [Actinoallomurus sp. CA-150999]|uniref:hypothetical protein n=1 Tax=Actinoallomurus sp. CA-150999 TaxID=3239887 RepID=UPI003D8AB4E5